jgi:hypothetical protein
MRLKQLGGALGVIVCFAAAAVVPAVSTARPAQNPLPVRHRITINAAPNPIVTGDPVVIFGRLFGPLTANQTVTLFHRLAGQPRFTPVQATKTDVTGAYEFSRAEGVVTTNRAWYVVSDRARSRTVRERVMALVTLSGPPSGSTLLTGPAHPYTFSGTVTPAKAGARVVLQRQKAVGGGDEWHAIDRGTVDATGHYTIVHRFVVPGDANIRVLLRGDGQNIASPSSPLQYQIEQAENPKLTLNAATNPLVVGQAEKLSGTLEGGGGKLITLFAHTDRQRFAPVAVTTADAAGNYAFSQSPVNNTFYRVQGGGKGSAVLFVGVQDALTVQVSANTIPAGGQVTFSGTVTPNKTGHVIYLQRQNASGQDFHTVQVEHVGPNSTYAITRRLFEPGTKVFRVLITGGPENQGAATAPITINVTPTPEAVLVPPQG